MVILFNTILIFVDRLRSERSLPSVLCQDEGEEERRRGGGGGEEERGREGEEERRMYVFCHENWAGFGEAYYHLVTYD